MARGVEVGAVHLLGHIEQMEVPGIQLGTGNLGRAFQRIPGPLQDRCGVLERRQSRQSMYSC